MQAHEPSTGPRLVHCRGPPPGASLSCRLEAHAALTSLRASRWVDQHTRAMSVHFALYNPATQLFSSVSLSSEVLPAGDLAFSSVVESVTVFHSNSARWYLRTLPEVSPWPLHLPVERRAHASSLLPRAGHGMASTHACRVKRHWLPQGLEEQAHHWCSPEQEVSSPGIYPQGDWLGTSQEASHKQKVGILFLLIVDLPPPAALPGAQPDTRLFSTLWHGREGRLQLLAKTAKLAGGSLPCHFPGVKPEQEHPCLRMQ